MKILLVEPSFPIPTKSKNHKNFLPISLLKLASYLRKNKVEIQLRRGTPNSLESIVNLKKLNPDEIWITSLFTYWSIYVREAVSYYKEFFPKSKVIVGGIYASLMPDHCKEYTGCDEVYVGIHNEAENIYPAYDLVDVNYQILHASRGCIRRCKFCGTYKIEPKFISKSSIKKEIKSNKLIFYDNNFLANKYLENILEELKNTVVNGRVVYSECQSGFDGRILTQDLANKLKKARFINPRIAWDNSYEEYKDIERQISYLVDGGYSQKDIYVFMVYNYKLPFEVMEEKRKKCYEWGVQIADCRFRPLNQTFDNYNPHKKEQSNEDYYIHPNWTDSEVRGFRKNVRRQNICIRQGVPFYSKDFEHKKYGVDVLKRVKKFKSINGKIKFLDNNNIDYWIPDEADQLVLQYGIKEQF